MSVAKLQAKTAGVLALAVLTVAAQAQNYVLQTVAGQTDLANGKLGTQSFLQFPQGCVTDSAGNLYFSDAEANQIWKLDTSGIMTLVAGNGIGGFSGDGKAATAAMLNSPSTLAMDGAGNLYILDLVRVRMVTPQGIITTVAGNGHSDTITGDGGLATSASMLPTCIAVDKAGNIYITENESNQIRKVSATTHLISVFAGNGTGGNTGNNGPATSAELYAGAAIAVDPAGDVYIADDGDCVIRKVDTKGIITEPFGLISSCKDSGDGGPAAQAGMYPASLAIDAAGSFLYLADESTSVVRRISLVNGQISTFAGKPSSQAPFAPVFSGNGGPALNAVFNPDGQIAVDPSGNLFITDIFNRRCLKVSAGNLTLTTVAGTGTVSDGPGTGAFFSSPQGIAFDGQGMLHIADEFDYRLRVFNPAAGTVSTTSVSGEFIDPFPMATDASGNLYTSSDNAVVKVSPGGTATTVTGSAFGTSGLAIDAAGNIYIAEYLAPDPDNPTLPGAGYVGKVTASNGIYSNIVGNGSIAWSGDGGSAVSAGIAPYDVAIDKAGNLYIADYTNHRVRKVNTSGTISTIAGTGTPGNSGNGVATQMQLYFPTGVAVDASGNVYICDSNGLLRILTPDGNLRTIAGNGATYPFNGDGPALQQNLDATRVAIDASGNIYISDTLNNRIRKLVPVNPAALAIVSGNNQSASAGAPLAQKLVVKVTDTSGNPHPGATVSFSAANNAATFNPPTAVTAADGTASTVATLGSSAGPVAVTATVSGVAAVTFSLTATGGAAASSPQIFPGGVVSAGLSAPTVQVASPNAILSIFGQNFAPAGTSRQVSGGDLVNGLVPGNLVGVCVLFGNQRAPMFLVTPGQLNVQVPQVPSSGSVAVQVISNCDTANQSVSNTTTVTVQPAAPEFFYAASNANGQNPVAAADGVTLAGVGDPARLGPGFALGYPGEVVVIYATGLGLSTPPYGAGALPPAASPVANVTVSIDGSPVDPSLIQYAGVTPLLAGVYQLNLQLPAGLAPGDHAIAISVNGAASPTGPYISVGPPPV